MSKKEYLSDAIEWTEKRAVSLKANFEGYEQPKGYTKSSTNEEVVPDISFVSQGGSRNYLEIVLKQDNTRKLVTKWKLLSLLASMKRGKLFLFAPRGHKSFTQKLVDKYNINARIFSKV